MRTKKASKHPPDRLGTKRKKPSIPPPDVLSYKVVELSTVDEGSLEATVNHWTARGWNLDGVQFAMRESSKRPAMAFIFFTRSGLAQQEVGDEDAAAARTHLLRLADDSGSEEVAQVRALSARQRLEQLAESEGDD